MALLTPRLVWLHGPPYLLLLLSHPCCMPLLPGALRGANFTPAAPSSRKALSPPHLRHQGPAPPGKLAPPLLSTVLPFAAAQVPLWSPTTASQFPPADWGLPRHGPASVAQRVPTGPGLAKHQSISFFKKLW